MAIAPSHHWNAASQGGAQALTALDESRFVVAMADGRRLDLGRDVHALFGLVFDALTLEQTVLKLRRCVGEREPCFVSTPNVNFVVAAQDDPEFRGSVLRSDLSVVDGMPLVWISRLLGLPLHERVAGSDVFDRLRRESGPPLKIYLFGGPEGVAERASAALNRQPCGMQCVGFSSPGFGSIESMSTPEVIERINLSEADFVVVALGARKGQAWIELNRYALKAPLVSHLGAVVNFVGGDVVRAPGWMQSVGLEWLWRVREEPALWRRYWRDAMELVGLVVGRVLPVLWDRLGGRSATRPPGFTWSGSDQSTVLHLTGDWLKPALDPLRTELRAALSAGHEVQIDLTGIDRVDSAVAGLLLLVAGWQGERGVLKACRPSPRAARLLRLYGIEPPLPSR
jgi:N-acetylglucosaminyldiphosphoundecaprenol N-acetyl-beta-D-mannosaminyltransferase